MCGIAGVMNSNYLAASEDFIREALVTGMVRGYDSSGIFQQDKDGKIYLHKEAMEGVYLAGGKKGQAYIKDAPKCYSTITHTRAATQGAVNDNNAHPFTVHKPDGTPMVGCHNGSLTTAWRSKPDGKEYDVDSHWALANIAKKGYDAFKEIFGAYCFVWAEADKPGKVFMVRNSQRPMHLLWTDDEKQCFFASEAGMLSWLCERNKIKTKNEIMVLGTDKIYEFDLKGQKVTFTTTDVPKAYVAPAVTHATQTRTPAGPVIVHTSLISEKKVGDLNPAGVRFVEDVKLAAKGKLKLNGNSRYSPYVFDAQKIKDTLETQEEMDARAAAIISTKIAAAQREVDKAVSDIIGAEEDIVTQQRADDSPFLEEDTDLVPITWFTTRGTKHSERDYAKAQGFYRELQWLEGVCWDENTGELMGDVEVWNNKTGKVKYTGVMRAVSRARAHADYIDNGDRKLNKPSGGWVVVSGMYEDKMLGQVFVLSELNMIGTQHMLDQRKKAN